MKIRSSTRCVRLTASGAAFALAGLAAGFTGGAGDESSSTGSASNMSFVLTDGRVEPGVGYGVRVDIIGTALTSGSTALPITLKINTGDDTAEPFGDADTTDGDINKSYLPVTKHIVPAMQDAGTPLTITATSWRNGSTLHQRNSHDQSAFVRVLRNGDATPDITGANGQENVDYFLRPYLTPDGSEVWLHDNQVLYLFELGTSDATSSAADFQDAVILVTLGETLEELEQDLPPRNDYAVPMRTPRLAD